MQWVELYVRFPTCTKHLKIFNTGQPAYLRTFLHYCNPSRTPHWATERPIFHTLAPTSVSNHHSWISILHNPKTSDVLGAFADFLDAAASKEMFSVVAVHPVELVTAVILMYSFTCGPFRLKTKMRVWPGLCTWGNLQCSFQPSWIWGGCFVAREGYWKREKVGGGRGTCSQMTRWCPWLHISLATLRNATIFARMRLDNDKAQHEKWCHILLKVNNNYRRLCLKLYTVTVIRLVL